MADTKNRELSEMIARYKEEMLTHYPQKPSHDKTVVTSPTNKSVPTAVSPLTDMGTLQVQVSTENQAVPIAGASVLVTKRENGNTYLVRSMITDESGTTEQIDLPTKDRFLSLSSDNIAPFETYDVDVRADGYFQKRFLDLPIYGGVAAIQSVSMIPLPEAADDDIVLTYPQALLRRVDE